METTNKNLELFNRVKKVPENYTKPYKSDFGKELTEISPMWRLEKLTELFGPAGQGFYIELDKQDTITVEQETFAVVVAKLYYRLDNKTWSKPVVGTGTSLLFLIDPKGKRRPNSDAFKMAYTDAVSNACKLLGMGADIYNSGYGEYHKAKAEQEQAAVQEKVEKEEKETQQAPVATLVPAREPLRMMNGVPVDEKEAEEKETQQEATEATANTEKQEVQADGKPVLTPTHPKWNQYVVWAARKSPKMDNEKIRESLLTKYWISEEDFNLMMKQAGRL